MTPSRSLTRTALPVALALVLTGCTSANDTATTEVDPDNPAVVNATAALDELQGTVLSKGPNGEEPAPATAAELTPEQIEKVKALGATAAISMHYGGDDWSASQIKALEEEFGRLGIEVVAVTDADFKPDKQVSDLQTIMAKKPDVIVSLPTDPVATAGAFQRVSDAGTELVFMDNAPKGMTAGEDYVSVVSADNYGNGVASAHLMAKELGGEGSIGLIYHEADFFVTRQRYEGFKKTIEEDYPEIEIVEETGIAGPDFAGDAQAAANAMLSQNPDLDGIWAVWDVPAEGVMAAARESGRTDLRIATQDLGKNVALSMAEDGLVVGLGAQRPYEQGVTEARLAALALLGEETPPYVAVPALPVDSDNVLDAWETVYSEEAPAELSSAREQ